MFHGFMKKAQILGSAAILTLEVWSWKWKLFVASTVHEAIF